MTEPLLDRVVAAIGHQYEIECEIGRGGMSVVYRARDLRLNRTVAIKVLPPELAYDPAVGTRFTREAQTAAQLSHGHIVPIYDVGERDGIAYFVMALITGGNVGALLDRQARRPIDEVRRLISEVADALSYAHLRGVIHRDIKADNILLDADSGRAMVTDFGIARAIEGGSRLTVTGMAVGTPTYMSPEQAVGERDLDGRSDIYSLGVLGYQMLAGRVPFSAGNPMALLLKHVSERPQPVAELRPEAPRTLCEAIERALAKAPEDRWPTAAAFRDALTSSELAAPVWRSESREPVRYASPIPRGDRRDLRAAVARRAEAERGDSRMSAALETRDANGVRIVLEQAHLVAFTPSERADLRLWGGRVNLLDRVRFTRRYAAATVLMVVAGMVAFAVGVDEAPPLVLAPLVPIYMGFELRRLGLSLRASGLRLRRVFNAARSKNVLPAPPPMPSQRELDKLAPRTLLDGPRGVDIRRAAEDRAAIRDIVRSLPKADRALLPDIDATVKGLVERVVTVAEQLQRLDADLDPRLIAELDARIAGMGGDAEAVNDPRRLALVRRQRGAVEELAQHRAALSRQIDRAGLALSNLRLDLIKLRSSGLDATLGDVSMATHEARALSRDIAAALAAAVEVRDI